MGIGSCGCCQAKGFDWPEAAAALLAARRASRKPPAAVGELPAIEGSREPKPKGAPSELLFAICRLATSPACKHHSHVLYTWPFPVVYCLCAFATRHHTPAINTGPQELASAPLISRACNLLCSKPPELWLDGICWRSWPKEVDFSSCAECAVG